MARSIDQIVMDALGVKEMVICRLQAQLEDLKDQVEALKQRVPAEDKGKSDE